MKRKLNIVFISDIHLGKLDVDYQIEQLEKEFFSYCNKKKPDLIVVGGDIMDRRVSLNSPDSVALYNFIDKLLELNTTTIIIEGTKSHDDNQTSVFKRKVSKKFMIIDKVTKLRVLDMDLLIIPEEYMLNPKEYYKDYIGKKYDFVFGHGTFSHLSYPGGKVVFRRLTSPIWDYDKDFEGDVYGNVIFGHDHKHSIYKQFVSAGSFGRYTHGQEEPKGFIEIEYDRVKKRTLKLKQLETKSSKIFKTIKVSELPENNDEMLSILSKLSKDVFSLRIYIDKDVEKDRMSDIISFTKKYVNSFIYKSRKKKKDNLEETVENKFKKNKYEDMSIEDATVEWVFENEGIKIDKIKINKILNSN